MARSELCAKCRAAPKHHVYHRCKACLKDYQKQWREDNPDKVKEHYQNTLLVKRHQQRAKRYGISEDDYYAWLERQPTCEICKADFSITKNHIDHDHATGKVRGLLCFNCNGGLGQFKDTPALLRAAADYLEQKQQGTK